MAEKTDPSSTETVRLADVLLELRRIDKSLFGNPTTGYVFRAVALEKWDHGTPARITTISQTVELSPSSVHQQLDRLQSWTDPKTGAARPLVVRMENGYTLTEWGERFLREWHTQADGIVRAKSPICPSCRYAPKDWIAKLTNPSGQRSKTE